MVEKAEEIGFPHKDPDAAPKLTRSGRGRAPGKEVETANP
jgi:hypothetical protein